MNIKLTVFGGILSAIILGSGVALAASTHPKDSPLPPTGSTDSHVSWSITGNVTLVASPRQFHGDGSLLHSSLKLVKPYYYVVNGTRVGDHYQYPFTVKAQQGVPVLSVELKRNDANGTELIEVGIPTRQSLQLAERAQAGGSSATSAGSAK